MISLDSKSSDPPAKAITSHYSHTLETQQSDDTTKLQQEALDNRVGLEWAVPTRPYCPPQLKSGCFADHQTVGPAVEGMHVPTHKSTTALQHRVLHLLDTVQ